MVELFEHSKLLADLCSRNSHVVLGSCSIDNTQHAVAQGALASDVLASLAWPAMCSLCCKRTSLPRPTEGEKCHYILRDGVGLALP